MRSTVILTWLGFWLALMIMPCRATRSQSLQRRDDGRTIVPDVQGIHSPMLLPEGTIWVHSLDSSFEGDIFFRIRQTRLGPVEGICIYAFVNYYGAQQCPPQPIQPELRPEMLGYAQGIKPPGVQDRVTVSLLSNAPFHPGFQCDVTISGYGLHVGYGFESVWIFTY